MNISEENNLSSLLTINLWKNWAICTQRRSIGYKQHSLSTILWYNTRREQICQLTTCPGYHHYRSFQLRLLQSAHLTLSIQTFSSCNAKTKICKQFSTSSSRAHGKSLFLSKNFVYLLHWLQKCFLTKNKLAWIRLEDHNYPRTA